jgi:hypothetical protein
LNFCLKEKSEQALAALRKPTVRNKIILKTEIYASPDAESPEFELNYSGNTETRLMTVVAVIGAAVVCVCLWRKLCGWLGL